MISLDDQARRQLVEAALSARQHAYAPYSEFPVGAAVLTSDGQIFSGCNVENVSYGLTNCAERTAIFSGVAAGQKHFTALAVATDGGHSPCGACRQVLAEFSDDMLVLLVNANSNNEVVETSLGELLPSRFDRR